MSKLIGDTSLVQRIDAARPGDPVVYVNVDFLESLPETFEARAVAVEFIKDKSFTNVGTEKAPSWYPGTKLMYDIADARGIACDETNILEPYYTEVDISRMEMTPNPCVMRKHTGYKATKSGRVQQEDGSSRTIVRDHIEDAWIECTGLWDKEELASEGYTKTVKDTYGREGYETEWNGKKSFHEYKYNNKYKRRVHFNDLLDKAMGKADTKVKMKVIRELACLKTGYTDADLSEGRFIFAKIVKSNSQIKLEAAARVNALSHGNGDTGASRSLFGSATPSVETPRNVTPEPVPTVRDVVDAIRTGEPVETVAEMAVKSFVTTPAPSAPVYAADQRAELIRVLKSFVDDALVPTNLAEMTGKIIGWLNMTPKATEDKTYWPKALSVLDQIEATLPDKRSTGIKR